ncbi:MAG TPA: DUF2341 domain-containing protein, partial [Thermodesulfobacteriota bacterium]|nr:DUF2341 domain-containing protein [Thermodesulfobacteriota bacterium]
TSPNRLATVWVKFDAIVTSATTFYMYYGNSGATAYSNGDNTFTFFDDFSGSAVNGNKWSQYKQGSSTITVESGLAKVKAIAGTSNGWVACILYTKAGISWARPFAIRVKWKENDTPSSWAQLNPIAIYKDAANQIGFERYSNNYRYWRKIIGGTSTYVTSEMWGNDSAYHISDFAFRAADWSAWIDGIQKVNADSENTLTTGFTLRFQPQEYYANQICEYWFDYVFVRNYVSSGSEPAWGSWGAEQTS